ncbi:MAG: ABC transporter ATP-binding protein [Gammaproteobacteria bacterium]|nr:ABC transporter ATP-binding protein [Gammaproteobacteria bacterium]|tara:strand:+ start:425987 stop:426697 length:711 start_codon:yes stop_codon:yes gene_type:complete
MNKASNNNFIRISQLSHSYAEAGQRHEVLHEVSVDIAQGESIALLGRSGSGKSTLLNIISGIDSPDTGSVTLDGKKLTAMSEKQRTLFRRQHIGFIYQFFNLVPSLTAAENIALTLELNEVGETESRERVEEIMQTLEIADKASRYPGQLSGGEQQRAAIARALIHQPLIVLADEPTGNLDARTGQSILQILQTLSQEKQSTLMLVTHSLEVAKSADRILTLEDGKLLEQESDFAW